jgi:hypothetical protein
MYIYMSKNVSFGKTEIKQIPNNPDGELITIHERKRKGEYKTDEGTKKCKIDPIMDLEANPMYFAVISL